MVLPEEDSDEVDMHGGGQSPENSTVLPNYGGNSNPMATLITTNPLFFNPKNYVTIILMWKGVIILCFQKYCLDQNDSG